MCIHPLTYMYTHLLSLCTEDRATSVFLALLFFFLVNKWLRDLPGFLSSDNSTTPHFT